MKQSPNESTFIGEGQRPENRAWIAEAWAAADGGPCQAPEQAALHIFCISVHEDYSATIDDRISLMMEIGNKFTGRVQAGTPSLWIFPAGYFGFEASTRSWKPLDDLKLQRIEREVRDVLLPRFPDHATVAFGVDTKVEHQQAWIVQRASDGIPSIIKVTRTESSLERRQLVVGSLQAAFFVCGEFTGSATQNNGAFRIDSNGAKHRLNDIVAQLSNCHVLVDLAHSRVPGSVWNDANQRMVHQRQMKVFSDIGVAILSHHHGGRRTSGRAHYQDQSNWIIYRGGQWLEPKMVTEI
jgi:hypothetical protein